MLKMKPKPVKVIVYKYGKSVFPVNGAEKAVKDIMEARTSDTK